MLIKNVDAKEKDLIGFFLENFIMSWESFRSPSIIDRLKINRYVR